MVKSTLQGVPAVAAVTELKEFPGRGHSLTIDSGWRELAQYSLAWLNAKGLLIGRTSTRRSSPGNIVSWGNSLAGHDDAPLGSRGRKMPNEKEARD